MYDDRRLARRLDREARSAARVHARAVRAHTRAVARRQRQAECARPQLRWQAARLAAVEPHRGAEPELVDLLYSGVVAQERLVAGMADLVSASADPLATTRLQDATDALHGLAQGLREVR